MHLMGKNLICMKCLLWIIFCLYFIISFKNCFDAFVNFPVKRLILIAVGKCHQLVSDESKGGDIKVQGFINAAKKGE